MFLHPLWHSIYSTTLYLVCIQQMLPLWQLGQKKVPQEVTVSWGFMNGFREEPSTCCCSSVFQPNGHDKLLSPLGVQQHWLILWIENIFRQHIYNSFCLFSHIFLRRNCTTKPTPQGELSEKNHLVKHECFQNSLISCCWCKHRTPWCKRLIIK